MQPLFKYIVKTGLLLSCVLATAALMASSHREAPLIAGDPLADNVDLYAFRSPDNPDMITIIATYIPMQLPHGGPNYYTFGENVLYEIHVDNDADNPGDEVTYRFTFNQVNEDPNTFFNIRLGNQNLKTTYTMERSTNGGQTFEVIVANGVVPPYNVGTRSITSPVGLDTDYATLFNSAITTTSTGERVFAGPTDDPFFVDLAGIFDLGDAPRQAGNPRDNLACYNVSAIAIEVPISTLLKEGAPEEPTSILDEDYVIGVWASASRPAIRTLSSDDDPEYDGDFVQVSRLGMPLTNEAVIPIGSKDYWNSITPYEEIADTRLDSFFYNPELALYMDDDLFGSAVPAFSPLRVQTAALGSFDFSNGADGLFGLKGSDAVEGTALDDAVFGNLLLPGPGQPRSVDLWPAFHTGVPNVIPYQLATGKDGNPLAAGKPFVNNFLPNGGDMLRLNMAVPVTPRDDPNFNSLGLINAAVLGLTVAPFNETTDLEFIPNMDGFPNGRRLEDDVTRIELQAVAGVVLAAIGLWYDDFDPENSPSPVTDDLLSVLSYTTGVEQNDREFMDTFPYLAMPRSGTGECSGVIYEDEPSAAAERVGRFYVSSNTQARIGVYNTLADESIKEGSFVVEAGDADGVYYNDMTDRLYQINRSANVIDVYGSVEANFDGGFPPVFSGSSTSDFSNGRELAVAGNRLVVGQDANDGNDQQNRLLIYRFEEDDVELLTTLDVDFNVWGLHADVNTLYAIIDNSAEVAIFDDFFLNEGTTVSPDRTFTVDGMVRTHGITYDADSDLMILTDVGAASDPDDGAFFVINNFTTAVADGVISDDESIRVAGPMSRLGNPVDVGYDNILDNIYIAERAKDGGLTLAFMNPAMDGDLAPYYADNFAGASAVYVSGAARADEPSTDVFDNLPGEVSLRVYPNPTAQWLDVQLPADTDLNGVSVQIFNAAGQVITDQTMNNHNLRLNVATWKNGTYFVRLVRGRESIQKAFLKID